MHMGSSQGCQRRFPPHFASGKEGTVQLFEQYMVPEEPVSPLLSHSSLLLSQVCVRAVRTESDHKQAVVHLCGLLLSQKGKRKIIPDFPSLLKTSPETIKILPIILPPFF